MIGQLTEQHRRAQAPDKPANQNKLSGYFGLAEKGKRIDALTLRLRSGRRFFLHYAYRFNIDVPSDEKIVLMATSAQVRISIEGRGLGALAKPLIASQVRWIQESENPLMDDGDGVFVSSIKIEGRAFDA